MPQQAGNDNYIVFDRNDKAAGHHLAVMSDTDALMTVW